MTNDHEKARLNPEISDVVGKLV